jgi:hypothetical protein
MAVRRDRAQYRSVVQNDCVAFIDMPRMLREIVDEALSHSDVRLVDEQSDGSLVAAVDRSGARFVIVSSEAVSPIEVCRLLEERPRVKVFAIADGGRDGCLYELRPNLVLVGELSPASVVQTVLGGRDREPGITTSTGR